MGYLTRAQITNLFTTKNALGSFAGNQQPNLQVNDLEPGEYTLQFQVIQPTIDDLNQATYAIVRWKVQGQQVQRIIGVFSGAVLTGVAEAVDVQLLDQSGRTIATPFPSLAQVTPGSAIVPLTNPVTLAADEQVIFASQPNITYALAAPVNGTTLTLAVPYTGIANPATTFFAQAPYKVGVTLSKGTRPTIMQPPVLITSGVVTLSPGPGPGAALLLRVPDDAGVISTLSSVTVDGAPPTAQAEAANGVVNFFGRVGAVFLGSYIPNQFQGWYPIPPGTTGAFLVNNSATATLDFTLEWGIEG